MIARTLAVSTLLLASAALLLPQKTSKADDDDVILRALRDELDRSRELRVVGGGDDTPFFFSYDLSDVS
jgi:hypothetical protein